MKMTTTRSFAPTEITRATEIIRQLMTEPPHPLGALWDDIETLLKKGWSYPHLASRLAGAGIAITQADLADLAKSMQGKKRRSRKSPKTAVAVSPATAAVPVQRPPGPAEILRAMGGVPMQSPATAATPATSGAPATIRAPAASGASHATASGASHATSQTVNASLSSAAPQASRPLEPTPTPHASRPLEPTPALAPTYRPQGQSMPAQGSAENGRAADTGPRGQQGVSAPNSGMHRAPGG